VCEIKYHSANTYVGVETRLHVFVTAALDGRDCCASSSDCFSYGEGAGGTSWMGGRVDLTSS
jgi:hypothetical protein